MKEKKSAGVERDVSGEASLTIYRPQDTFSCQEKHLRRRMEGVFVALQQQSNRRRGLTVGPEPSKWHDGTAKICLVEKKGKRRGDERSSREFQLVCCVL